MRLRGLGAVCRQHSLLDLTPACQDYDPGVSTVKQVADRIGLPSRTVRYYDRIGLVRPRERSDAGYRLYSAEDEGRLLFVRQAKALSFSLEEIRQLMLAAESGFCGQLLPELERLLDTKLAAIDARIAELTSFRERLAGYQAGKRSGCGCHGRSPFCGCLHDAPLIQLERKRHGM